MKNICTCFQLAIHNYFNSIGKASYLSIIEEFMPKPNISKYNESQILAIHEIIVFKFEKNIFHDIFVKIFFLSIEVKLYLGGGLEVEKQNHLMTLRAG